MSNLYQRKLSLAGLNLAAYSEQELAELIAGILADGIHGISFSPYVAGQSPGSQVTEAQIRERLAIVSPHVRWIRTFSCTEGHELIPAIAREANLKTLVGVWLDDDREHNELELRNALQLANDGLIDILAIGNEVLLRGDLSEDELLAYIERAKDAAPGVEVGYVDAYFEFEQHPRITAACDVLLANCYPFWEGCSADYALLYMKEMYRRTQAVADGRRVIVSETGWPSQGSAEGGAVPSRQAAMKYFIDTCRWAEEDDIEFFYFSAFDEAWKVGAEGDVGAYWGLWDAEGKPKFC